MRILSLLAIALFASSALAQAPEQKPESVWQKIFRQQAAAYRFRTGDDEGEVKVSADPILFWSQPVRGGDDGAIYLWTKGGRPQAIGAFFIWPWREGGQAITHELHSLSDKPFTATWQERPWKSPEGAVSYQALTDATPPAETPERRLQQMKLLAREFAATSHGKDDRDWELRLLPRPLYRYELTGDQKSTVLDGVLFGFVQGTDLEIVLMLEAVRTEKGNVWRWSAARMSDLPLALSRGDAAVWQVEKATFDQANAAYFCGTVKYYSEPPKDEPN
jgi:hypothetical protein